MNSDAQLALLLCGEFINGEVEDYQWDFDAPTAVTNVIIVLLLRIVIIGAGIVWRRKHS